MRSADLEARALFVRGGLYGSVRETLGNRPAAVAAAALLADRLMLGALAAVVAGHYLVAFGRSVAGITAPSLVGDSGPMTFALAAIGVVWLMQRQGRSPNERTVAQAVGGSVAVLLFLVVVATLSALFSAAAVSPLPPLSVRPLALAATFGFVLSALGSVESLSQAALDLEQPRIRNLERVLRLIGAYGVVVTAGLAFLFALTVRDQGVWGRAPLLGVANQLAVPVWLRQVVISLVAAASVAFLTATIRSTARGAYGVLGPTGGRRVPRRPLADPASSVRHAVARHRRGRRHAARDRAASPAVRRRGSPAATPSRSSSRRSSSWPH